ncbi:cobalamin B12-binding domain-containing protein [Rhodobacter ferrooxidans]|uniref:B12-binding domain-containing protein n=1 Tax=Rhodobacter ferrooxidans TaxID=371731 RepID=C8S0B0_9RHOB|nr:cobalamin-dependent protein [Rhodobacter sp. SW2]EEW25719.1 conserved hypothetical protein [Rhodobacter sp. SW2]
MTGNLNESSGLDRTALDRANDLFRSGRATLPQEAVHALAQEVIARLDQRNKETLRVEGPVPQAEIDALCVDLLAADENVATDRIMRAHDSGVSIERLYFGYLAQAARQLGEMWEDDEASLLEVAIGTGRIYAIMRGLRRLFCAESVVLPDEFRAVFAASPGETHTLGVTMAADQMRRRGWQIDLKVGMSHEELVDSISHRQYPIIGLSASCTSMIFALSRLIVALRIRNPGAWIMISGKIADLEPDLMTLTDADAVVKDLPEAEVQMQNRLQARLQAQRRG